RPPRPPERMTTPPTTSSRSASMPRRRSHPSLSHPPHRPRFRPAHRGRSARRLRWPSRRRRAASARTPTDRSLVEVPVTVDETQPEPDAPTEAQEHVEPPDDAAKDSRDEGRFGTPGPPLDRRNPFLIGFLGGLGVLLAYAVFLGVRNATSILILIFVAMFLAIGLNPAVNRIRSWGLPRGAAVGVVTLVGLGLLVGGLYALVPPLITQTGQLIDNIPEFIQSLQRNQTINELVQRYDLINKVQSAINASTAGTTLGGVLGAAGLIFGTTLNVPTFM